MTHGRIRFDDISPTAWEHPSDRVALNALRELRGFDTVLRKLVGLLGEKQLRLAFRANAVRVSERQYPWVHEALLRGCEILDVEEPPQLYVAQTPIANAGAYGLDTPFIILNSSLIEVLGPEETEAVIGHELGHVISGHALYRTMLYILLEQTSLIQWTPASIAVRPVVLALLEWSRKAEVSCDRAGLLVAQDPKVSMSALMKLAGGTRGEDLDVDEFIRQSDEYLEEKGFLDRTYKTLSLLGATHPFAVLRVAELRRWIDEGDYERILDGDYRRRSDDTPPPYRDDLAEAGQGYVTKAGEFIDSAENALLGVVDRINDIFSSDESEADDRPDEAGQRD
jgi:Zn-dependent protease with chaperone function